MKTRTTNLTNVLGRCASRKISVGMVRLPGMLQGFFGAILTTALLLLVVFMAGCSHDKGGIAGFCDNTPPLLISITPACGATGVVLNQKVTVTFNEGMDQSTVTNTTFTLAGPGGTPVTGTVTYISAYNIATFTPASNLAANTTYTYTIKGGANGVKDLTGNALTNDFACNFTTGTAPDGAPPTVNSTDPANNETGVALNKIIAATFSEAMDPSTITTATFTLKQGTTPVSGTVTYAGTGATFRPASNLAANTIYTATITTGAEDLAVNALASNYVWSFTTGAAPDVTPPTVISTDPANNATGVALNKIIAATFSEAMDPSTITTATFTLKQGTTPVSGTVTYTGTGATFTPASNLAASTIYTATITTGAEDLAGNALASNYVWSFTTGTAPDVIPPTVISTDPANNETGVALNKIITATFSEAMDPSTITTATFTLKLGTTPVSGTVTYAGTGATFTPASNLAASTIYTATITTGAEDLAGNALASNYVWSFTTGTAPDVTPPTVISTDPANNATGVALNKIIAATFSEAMDPSTITTTTFTLKQGTTPVSGTVTHAGTGATFTPASNLAYSTVYTATITTGAEDLAGNALASNYVWTFTTGAAPDVTPPTVISTDPANNETGVALNKIITATFSEAMDPSTITTTTFTLKLGTTPVSGTVTYTGTGATFTPASNLAASTIYTATITTGAEDLAGNALASNYVWTFTTGAAPDVTPPTVISTDPANNETGVALNKIITATFSEAMDSSTITTATFTLKHGTTPVSGTVTYTGTTATFTPSSNLAYSTVYTATITTGAEDLAGNALASNYVWSFTTGTAPDVTPPTVISTDPANNETGVALNKIITATFSEAMDPSTITTATFTLKLGTTPVSGTVTYTGTTATFRPAINLAASTIYTGTITTGAEDLAGNALASNYIWTFTTGAAPDTTLPSVISTDPADNETGVVLNKIITATFSEAMDPSTITTATFTLMQGTTPVSGAVTYAGTGAIFAPESDLAASTVYTATITTGAEDLAGNALASNYVWSFTTAAEEPPSGPPTVNLDCATGFVILAGATVTNTGATIVDGDLGLSPGSAVVGFPPGQVVNGAIHINDAAANNAKLCLTTAYNDAAGRSVDVIVVSDGELGGKTLAPGLYRSAPGSFGITSSDLTLDAQGDSNAVWIFQMPSSTLTVGNGRSVILAGGAQAKNIFWQVGSSATIGTTAAMQGNILADQSITLMTGATLVGRVLTRIAAVTLDSNSITKP